MPIEVQDYTLAELEDFYREVHPGASRSEVRRGAKAERRRRENDASLINGLTRDPTPREAFDRICENDRAAARRLGLR